MSSDLINEIEIHHSQNKHGMIFGEEYGEPKHNILF
jgi:hypothetical protein